MSLSVSNHRLFSIDFALILIPSYLARGIQKEVLETSRANLVPICLLLIFPLFSWSFPILGALIHHYCFDLDPVSVYRFLY